MSDTTTNGGSVYDSVSYHPRLCHLTKWEDFNGYGFNLHAEKGKAGQYIGKVDEGSPAVGANLRQGDRIVEVNGVNIGNENHQQVVQRIKAGGEETKLLVVDAETDLYFKEKKIVVRGEMEEVIYCKTPLTSAAISTEGPVHVNSNHIETTESLNHNEETGEEIKEVDTVDAAPVVVNGVTEEVVAPVEAASEPVENGIYETVVTETEVIEVTPEPMLEIPPEPVVAAPEPEVELVAEPEVELVAEPEPVVAIPEPEVTVSDVVTTEVTGTEVVTTEVVTTEVVTTEVVTSEIITEPAAPEPEVVPEPEPEPVPVAVVPEPEPEPVPVAVVPEPEPEPVVVVPVPEPIAEAPKTQNPFDFGNVSVEEMKKRIQSKKKADTRFSQMGLREKYDLLQRL